MHLYSSRGRQEVIVAGGSVYQKEYSVRLSDVDFTEGLKLSSLFMYLQDIASDHADDIGYGFHILEGHYGLTWVLMRIKVEIIRNPKWNEKITIETWPQVPKKLEFQRDFLVQDQEGNTIIKAISTWALMDIKTRELRRSDTVKVDYPPVRTERVMDFKLGRIKAFGQTEFSYKKIIGYSDVDLNCHLNNTKYIDYIMDCFSLDSFRQYDVKGIEVNYINEALPGDTINLYKDISQISENRVYIEGVNEKDQNVSFRALIEIEKKSK
jgi:medium-chain acyl-[acyl-carrier-protein] hydrolase